jgi:hypothetical protein
MCDFRLSEILTRTLTIACIVATSAVWGCGPHADDVQLSVRIASPAPDISGLRDEQVSQIYAAAKRRDTAALLAMHDPTDPAIAFALFTIDPAQYRDAFIAAYPDTPDGVNGDYGYRLVRSHLVAKGALVPIVKLGGFAASGDARARERLLTALPLAQGRMADAYAAEGAHDLFAVPPAEALDALVSLPPDVRLAATSEIAWCGRRPDRILAYVPPAPPAGSATPAPALASPTPSPDLLVQDAIRQSLTQCARIAFTPSRRTAPRGATHRKPTGHAKPPRPARRPSTSSG